MIDETIREASQLVGEVPYQEVFDWRRLKRLARWLIALSFGPGSVLRRILRDPTNESVQRLRAKVRRRGKHLGKARCALAQRHLAVKAMLEVVDFPANGQLKISREGQRRGCKSSRVAGSGPTRQLQKVGER